ncbi:MAG: hypothetical protein LBT50_03480 [Prevotellaceae bacterium]|nr:hypothetical protein [Prevotellaceae bacterium]
MKKMKYAHIKQIVSLLLVLLFAFSLQANNDLEIGGLVPPTIENQRLS